MSNIKPDPKFTPTPGTPTAAPRGFPCHHRSLAEIKPMRFSRCPHGEPLSTRCADCDREHREATA